MSLVLVPSRYHIYPGISVEGASHAGFNNRTIYTLWTFIIAWIVLLIGEWYLLLSVSLRRNRDHEPRLKYGMTWWHNGLHKYRRDLMESVAKVVLLKSGELTSGGGIPSGELISLGEENGFGNVLDIALTRRFSLWVSSETSDDEGHVSWSWRRSDFDHYRCSLHFLFLLTSREKSGAKMSISWLGKFEASLVIWKVLFNAS